MASNIVTLNIDGTDYVMRPSGTVSSAASQAAKVVSCDGFSLTTGATILVKFTNGNTAVGATLNVNSTGAKTIYCGGAKVTSDVIQSNVWYEFYYDGAYWQIIGVDPAGNGASAEIETLKSQIQDLKDTLNSIITGKSWSSSIWPS